MSEYERTPGGAVDSWLSSVEGMNVGHFHDDNEAIVCDFCSDPVLPNRKTTHYAAHRLLNNRPVMGVDEAGNPTTASNRHSDSQFNLLRIYCPDCSTGRVKFPCAGYHELIIEGAITPDKHFAEGMAIRDLSPASDGVEWDPRETWEKVTEVPFDVYVDAVDNMELGPEDIVDGLLAWDIDIRDVVDDSGAVHVTDEVRKQRDEALEQLAREKAEGKGWDPRG